MEPKWIQKVVKVYRLNAQNTKIPKLQKNISIILRVQSPRENKGVKPEPLDNDTEEFLPP